MQPAVGCVPTHDMFFIYMKVLSDEVRSFIILYSNRNSKKQTGQDSVSLKHLEWKWI